MSRKLLSFFAGICFLPVLFVFTSQTASAQAAAGKTVTIAAAADLKFALEAVKQEFAKEHPEIAVTVVYGSSGNFFSQIANGAPFDVFLSADMDYPKKLADQGLVVEGSSFQYAVGRVVLWAPNGSKVDIQKLGMKAVLDASVQKIAVANPEHAPYGKAAVAAMKSLGVYDQAQPKFVYGENIAQTAQYVESGAADLGFVALALALAPEMKGKGNYWELPLSAYPRMDQGGVILKAAKDANAAAAFRSFMMSAKAKEILKGYGFSIPDGK